jgi:nicotinic acid mononucleotide adenylyltransferase
MDEEDIKDGAEFLIQCYREYTGKSVGGMNDSAKIIVENAARRVVQDNENAVVLRPTSAKEDGQPMTFETLEHLPNGCLVFPGSFNPPHGGHIALANASLRTADRCNEDNDEGDYNPTVFFEISIVNADKPPIDPEVVAERVKKFLDLDDMPDQWGVVLTRAPLFADKLTYLKDCINSNGCDSKLNFIIGTDTLVRIVNPKYYGNDEKNMIESLRAMKGAHFIVGGRLEQNVETDQPRFVSGEEELSSLPHDFANDMFTIMRESEFRVDISSSEIRRKQAERERIN